MRSTRFWILLIAANIAVCLVASVLLLAGRNGSRALVKQNGEVLYDIDLSTVDKPYTFTVDSPAGTNTVEVERGRIRVVHADCPDQICVRQGWISNGVVPIVCLPNGLVIEIVNAPDPGIDGVTQ